ncbi:unnamed protein product [Trichogramma brassicae]|uniref:C2H2-type domain-containing protein n=1 Tax=Trichogramma brassicae TaxID=86971 RepID=A0A6H5J5U6_9HYME|nr:unnamed protein product [Trichogramma brassicae]
MYHLSHILVAEQAMGLELPRWPRRSFPGVSVTTAFSCGTRDSADDAHETHQTEHGVRIGAVHMGIRGVGGAGWYRAFFLRGGHVFGRQIRELLAEVTQRARTRWTATRAWPRATVTYSERDFMDIAKITLATSVKRFLEKEEQSVYRTLFFCRVKEEPKDIHAAASDDYIFDTVNPCRVNNYETFPIVKPSIKGILLQSGWRLPCMLGENATFEPNLLTTHEGRKNYACDKCEKVFRTRRYILVHQRTVHEGRRDFECDKCEKKFGNKQQLLRHRSAVHEGRKDYRCDKCEKMFGDPSTLIRHRKVFHEGRHDFTCLNCEKKFGYKADLLRHQRTVHEGCKDFVCDKCGKKFGEKWIMIQHRRTVHEGRKDFACDKCEKKFGFKSNLFFHRKTVHEGRKDYACDNSSSSSSSSSSSELVNGRCTSRRSNDGKLLCARSSAGCRPLLSCRCCSIAKSKKKKKKREIRVRSCMRRILSFSVSFTGVSRINAPLLLWQHSEQQRTLYTLDRGS